ncbi:hypothetical protein RI367_002630 [Sorochytrium milnesiophthora]
MLSILGLSSSSASPSSNTLDALRVATQPLLTSPTAWLASSAALAYAYYCYTFSMYHGPTRRPPGPSSNQFSRIKESAKRGEFHMFTDEMVEEYGDFVSVKVRNRWTYITADADVAKQVLADNERFTRTQNFANACNAIGPMLFAMSGPVWKAHRKAIAPAFTAGHLRTAVGTMHACVDQLCQQVDAAIEQNQGDWSAPLNVHALFTAVALDIFGRAFFSFDFDSLQNPDSPLCRAVGSLSRGVSVRTAVPRWLWPFLVRDSFAASVAVVRQVLDQAIGQRIQQLMQQGEDALLDKEKDDMDLLDNLLLAANKQNEPISAHDLASEMIGLFLAGHETTASTLTYTVRALCDHPDWAQQLREELQEEIGDNPLDADSIPRLRKLDLFIKETMRFYSVVAGVTRTTSSDTEIRGYPIPKGSALSVRIRSMHHSPKYWTKPEIFNPLRFETDTIVPGTYMPFGDGAHKCMGERLAMLEVKLVLASLLQRYQFKLKKDQSFKLVMSVTLGYKEGLFVHFRPL